MRNSNLPSGHTSFVVTPHASTNLPTTARAIYVGGAGAVAVVAPDDTVTVWPAVTAGSYLWVACKRVNAVGTTATNMVGIA
jgi:hypothetical protein